MIDGVRKLGYAAALSASLFGTACAKKEIEVRNDYATEAYVEAVAENKPTSG